MKEMLHLLLLLGLTGPLAVAIGGIPEPDALLYGGASINGVAVQQQQDVSVIARTALGVEVGRYDFFDCNANVLLDPTYLLSALVVRRHFSSESP